MKISDWLQSALRYDEFHDSPALKRDFQDKTGFTPPDWPEEPLAKGMEQSLYVYPDPGVPRDQIICYGIEVAQAVERAFVPGLRPSDQHYSGRGMNFRAIVVTLQQANL